MNSEKYEKYSKMSTGDDIMEWLHHSKEFADVVFIVGSAQKIILAHKFILRMSSPKFDEMLCNNRNKITNHVSLPEVESHSLELMLRNIYKQKVEFESLEETLKVLSLAITYELSGLKEMCFCHIENLMATENVRSVFRRSVSIEHEDLTLKSFKIIQEEAGSILKQTQLEEVLPCTLEYILKQDHVNIHSELQLLETLVSWAKIQLDARGKEESPENLRHVMDPFLKHIRFFCISEVNFVKIQMDTQIFSDEEIGQILMNYTIRNSCELPTWFNKNTTCRTCKCKPDQISLDEHIITSHMQHETSIPNKTETTDLESCVTDEDCLKQFKQEHFYLQKWMNISKILYSYSERLSNLSSKFISKNNGFFIRRLVISMCDNCFHHNRMRKRSTLKANVTIKAGETVQETIIEILILSGHFRVEHPKSCDQYLKEPMIVMRYFDEQKLIFPKYFGMEAPILHDYLDPVVSTAPKYVDIPPPRLSETIEVMPPMYVKRGELLELSMQTTSGEPFYCCEKEPSFDNTPFAICEGSSKDGGSKVWCAFSAIEYFLPES